MEPEKLQAHIREKEEKLRELKNKQPLLEEDLARIESLEKEIERLKKRWGPIIGKEPA